MRLAVTSDIHIDKNGDVALTALAERVSALRPDVLLVSGDIATSPAIYLQTVLTLKSVAPELLLVAGNHDVWTTPDAALRGLDSFVRLEKILPALAREAGARLLDEAPVEIGGIGFVGSLGWYDLSTRERLLDVPDSAYHAGEWGGLRWMDHHYANWYQEGHRLDCVAVAGLLRARLAQHLAGMTTRRIVAATHMLAFSEQIHRKPHPGWSFVNAFMGSDALGELLRADPRVALHIAGHTHLPSDVRIGRLRAVVSPLGYKGEWAGATVEQAVRRAVTLIEL